MAKSGDHFLPNAEVLESVEKLFLELHDRDDLLGDLEKCLLRESGKHDDEIKRISILRLMPDTLQRLANAVSYVSDIDGTPALEEHPVRIEKSLEDDPGLAIGSAKELMEAVAKRVIERFGKIPDPKFRLSATHQGGDQTVGACSRRCSRDSERSPSCEDRSRRAATNSPRNG